MALVLKINVVQATVGSNPTVSAIFKRTVMILVVDMDETLITDLGRCDKYGDPSVEPERVEYGKFWAEDIYVRPYCREFLAWANSHFKQTILCIFSSRDRARILLRELSLGMYFDVVYVHEDISCDRLQLDDFLLVDDCEWNDTLLLEKLRFLGVPNLPFACTTDNVLDYPCISEHHVNIKRFVGNLDDAELMRVKKVLEIELVNS